jgi:CTP synthase
VQVIPHITNEIKARMRALATGDKDAPDLIITEIGGTVGDIESLPFLEAARQVRHDIGRDNCFFLHVSLVPYLAPSGELKTKPTQHSVAALRQVGIQPDGLVLRADRPIPEAIKRKISLMCDVDQEACAAAVDAPSIYDIPKVLHGEGLDAYVIRRLGLGFRDVNWTSWDEMLKRVHDPEHEIEIALVGKYIDLPDAYLSVTEALRAGGFHHDAKVKIRWVASDECQTEAGAQRPSAGSTRSSCPVVSACAASRASSARCAGPGSARCPPSGICLGLQCMVIEYARSVLGIADASSSEFDPQTSHPVIATMAEQKAFVEGAGDLGGTMRLGRYAASSPRGHSWPRHTGDRGDERHRHRYEVNNAYREQLRGSRPGVLRAVTRTASLVEFVELPADVHPYYVATQAHPEFLSRPNRAHPLFAGPTARPAAGRCRPGPSQRAEPAGRRGRARPAGRAAVAGRGP